MRSRVETNKKMKEKQKSKLKSKIQSSQYTEKVFEDDQAIVEFGKVIYYKKINAEKLP
jgi:hypothetical protein